MPRKNSVYLKIKIAMSGIVSSKQVLRLWTLLLHLCFCFSGIANSIWILKKIPSEISNTPQTNFKKPNISFWKNCFDWARYILRFPLTETRARQIRHQAGWARPFHEFAYCPSSRKHHIIKHRNAWLGTPR